MPEVKTGDVLNCEVCGLTVIVNEECECADAEIFCCEEPMVNKGPASKKAARGKKTAAKKVSPAAKKTAKTAAKKTAAKKMKK